MTTQGCSLEELKSNFNLFSHEHSVDELYTIAGSLTQTQMKTTKCRQYVAEFEEKHLFYFSLFQPNQNDASKSWITRVKEDIKKVKQSGVAPTLREIFAVSEIINSVIFLLFEFNGNTIRALQIQSVIRENEIDQPPLILLLLTNTEGPCFQRIVGGVGDLKRLNIEIINASHTDCLDKRFRNNFEDLQGSFMLNGEDIDYSSNLTGEDIETQPKIFSLCSQIVYGNKINCQAVKECVKMHMEEEDFREVYMQFVDVKSYTPTNEYAAMENISDTGKKEKNLTKLTKKAFENHLREWKYFTLEEFFAISSVYNIDVFVILAENVPTLSENYKKEVKLFLPICGGYLYTFKTPFVFKNCSDELFKASFSDQECLCCTDIPGVVGKFPTINDEIDLSRVKKLDISPCCPNLFNRHGRHLHFQHLCNDEQPGKKGFQARNVTKYCSPMSKHIEKIQEIMEEDWKILDAINGGKGTLSMCIRKEIFDDENARLPVSLAADDDVQKSLEIVTDWTGIPIYVFLYSEKVQWVLISPRKCNEARNPACRYYMTILYNAFSGYFDRIVPKNGCNCLHVHPYVESSSNELMQVKNSTVSSETRHWPLVTFMEEKPRDNMFSDDVRQGVGVIPMYSEVLLIMEREDMKDYLIDEMSDYAYSLFRCISKEMFGNEKQFQMIMMKIVREIKENPLVYGHLLMNEKKNSDSEFLENFRYRKHRTFDFLRFHETLVKESAEFFADRIEDGMNLGDLELFAVATHFQVAIYVLSTEINEQRLETKWMRFSQINRKKLPTDFARRRQYLAGENSVHKCVSDESRRSKYYITLYRTFSGQYHRIVPKDQLCNCLKDPPLTVSVEHNHEEKSDFMIYSDMNNVKSKLTIAKLRLDNWLRCNVALEIFCNNIIDTLEGRRQNANISSIVGSSVGIAGSSLAIAGLVTAPFTAGVSLGLAVAAGVIGTLGSLTVIGTKITEFVLSRKAISRLECYQMNLRENSRCMEKSFRELQDELDKFTTEDADSVAPTVVQAATGALRMLGGFPIIIARVILRAVTIADAILPPLSIMVDVGVLAYSIHNLRKGSKTKVTERLRKVRSVLRTTRVQMFTWGYGNQKNHLETLEYLSLKKTTS